MTQKNNEFNIDPEMYSFLKEHFAQGSLVACETIRDNIVKDFEKSKEQQALTEDFKKGWIAAYQHIISNLDTITRDGLLGNFLTDEDQFDRLFLKFQQAFPETTEE